MRWAAPLAWWLAGAVVLPLVAHLWSRRRPSEFAFPTLRFLRAASPVSRRLRRLQERWLFLWRVVTVLLVCAAAAGPTLTAWRIPAVPAVHRLVAVDGRVAQGAARAIEALEPTAASTHVVGPGPLTALLDDVMREAARAEPGTEVVLIWDGSTSTVTPESLAALPSRVGLRLLPLTADARGSTPSVDSTMLVADSDRAQRDAVWQQVAPGAGATGVHPVVHWPGTVAPTPSPETPPTRAAIAAIDDLIADVRVRDAAERSAPATAARGGDLVGAVVSRDAAGTTLLSAWGVGDRLHVQLFAPATSPLALWSAVASMEALTYRARLADAAPRWTDDAVRAATRAPAQEPPPTDGGRHTRWVWVAVLGALALEQWWRRRPAGRQVPNAV